MKTMFDRFVRFLLWIVLFLLPLAVFGAGGEPTVTKTPPPTETAVPTRTVTRTPTPSVSSSPTPSVQVTVVPTLGTEGLVALGVLLGIVAVVAIRRT